MYTIFYNNKLTHLVHDHFPVASDSENVRTVELHGQCIVGFTVGCSNSFLRYVDVGRVNQTLVKALAHGGAGLNDCD